MLGDVGWVQGVIENKRTGNLIDGHARIEEVLWNDPRQRVPYLQVDLSEAEERAVLATLDPIGAMAEVDPAAVDLLFQQTIADMPALEGLLRLLHYGELAGAEDHEPRDAAIPVDRAPDLAKKWGTARGQLWAIGRHRLACGDCTNAGEVARLLDHHRPELLITDPPYGVDYDPAWRVDTVHREGELAGHRGKNLATVTNDDRVSWRAAFELAPAAVCYVWHADRAAVPFALDLRAAGFELRSQIVWCKPNFVISRGHYHYQHEAAWYGVRHGQKSGWVGDHSQSTVWQIAGLQPMGRSQDEHDRATGHGTQKPLECMARPIRNHAGEVYDPFVGSGTTLVAAENLNRRCFAADIDPGFVAVALERLAVAFPKLKIRKLDQ